MTTLEDEFYTVKMVADLMQMSTSTVNRRIKSEELPSLKIGGLRRIRRSDFERYICALRKKPK